MPSIDEFAAAIHAALERIKEAASSSQASRRNAGALRERFAQLGAEDKSDQAASIETATATMSAQLQTATGLAEAALTRAAALHGTGGPDSTNPASNRTRPKPPEFAVDSGYPHHRPHTISWSDLHHVLNGDPDDPEKGGHAYDTGRPGKTEFPQDWDDEDIKAALIEVASRPLKTAEKPNGSWFATGTVRGVVIRTVVKSDGSVSAGWPIKGPGVRTNQERRR